MKQYIELELAIQAVNQVPSGNWDNKLYESALMSVPAADVRDANVGHWVDYARRGIYGMLYACSECGAKYTGKSNFCPNCGADMRETNEK